MLVSIATIKKHIGGFQNDVIVNSHRVAVTLRLDINLKTHLSRDSLSKILEYLFKALYRF